MRVFGEEVLERAGSVPLPPYITEQLEDKERYQTVYAKEEGSAAAPTAGLHFTKELLERIQKMGVSVVEILLHVGWAPSDRSKPKTLKTTRCTRNTTR